MGRERERERGWLGWNELYRERKIATLPPHDIKVGDD